RPRSISRGTAPVDRAPGGPFGPARLGAPGAVFLGHPAIALGPRRPRGGGSSLRREHLPGAKLALRHRGRSPLALPALAGERADRVPNVDVSRTETQHTH